MKRYVVWVLAICATLTAACNTVQGIGKDVKRGGEAIERAAR